MTEFTTLKPKPCSYLTDYNDKNKKNERDNIEKIKFSFIKN